MHANIHRLLLPSALVTGLLVAGCTPQPNATTYGRGEAMRAQTVDFGAIVSIRPVQIRPDRTIVGTATGAALGGLAGSQLGGGTAANVAGGVAGAVAGGAIGSAIQGSQSTPGLELTVRLDSGRTVAVVQAGGVDDFRVGDRVRVTSDGQTTRVSR
jgi:outer membrane lipoprotein SlyB